MNQNIDLISQGIVVVPGTSATITVAAITPRDYAIYCLFIGEDFPANVGTEPVSIAMTVGTTTTTYPLIDNAGNLVVLGTMRGGRFACGNIKAAKYRLQFGANGMPGGVPHFVVHNGLCPMRFNGVVSLDILQDVGGQSAQVAQLAQAEMIDAGTVSAVAASRTRNST